MTPGGNIDIQAKNIQIVEARETSRTDSKESFSQSGISLGVKSPLLSTLQSAMDTSEAMGDTKSDRMRALGAASMAMSGYSTYQGISNDAARIAAGQSPQTVGGGAALTLGSSSSETTSTQSSDTAVGSRLQAGGNVTLNATGGGKDSNILVRGSQIDAGKNVNLSADNNITLEAAANSSSQSSSSRSSNGSIGVGYSVGQATGLTIEVAAGSQHGRDNGTDSNWTNTTVSAGQQVNIASGGDTTLRGATVSGKRINADVGGNLSIETLQDTSTYHSQNSGAGFNATICAWYCYGESSVSINAHNMRGDGDFASATQQSGFLAGDGGFGVKVAGNTNLVGGVISSTDAAVNSGRNSFSSGSLTMTDLVNHDTFKGSGYSINVSTSTSGSGSGGAGIGSNHVNQSSTTQSGISGIAGNSNVRTGVDTTNALRQTNFDRAMRDVGAQVQLTAQFGAQATHAAGSYADQKFQEAVDNKDAEGQRLWGANGAYRVAMHAGIGALTGGVGGAVGATASSLSITEIGALIYGLGLPTAVAQGLTQALALAIGGALGGSAGAAGSFNEASNNNLQLIMRMGQITAQFAQQGWSALTADAQALAIMCARSQACSALLSTSMLLAINASQTRAPEPTGASAIPVGSSSPLPPQDPMVNVPIRPDQAGGTSTSGDVLPGQGSPGYVGTNPTGGNSSTSMPNNGANAGPLGWIVMNSQGTSPPKSMGVEDIKGPTVFTLPSQGQRISGENAGVRLGGWGEDLANGLLDQLGSGGYSLQNSSDHGADRINDKIDHVNKKIPVFEIKNTEMGNRQPVGNLPVRFEDWIKEAAQSQTIAGRPISPTDQAKAIYLNDLLQNKNYTLDPYVVEVAVPAQGQTGRPTVQITPWPVPRGTSRPRIAPP